MKRFFLSMAGALLIASISAQSIPRSFNAGYQALIEEAVRDGIFLVRQSYQLKNIANNTLYGWGHAEHFGYSLSLGIMAENGYYVEPQAVEPWKYDRKFIDYNDQRYYVPFVSESRYRPLTGSAYFVLPYQTEEVKPLTDNPFWFVCDSVFDNRGFEADYSNGKKEGWLVWVVSPDSVAEDADAALSLLVYRNELVFEAGVKTCAVKDPSTAQRILGGLYITPHVAGVGKVSFRVNGLLQKGDEGWQVVRLSEPADVVEIERVEPDKKGLTPIRTK
jgi:hypothetical protein